MRTNINTNQSIWQNIQLKAFKNLRTLAYLCFNVKKGFIVVLLIEQRGGKEEKERKNVLG